MKSQKDHKTTFSPVHIFSWISVHLFIGMLLILTLSGCASDPYKDMDVDAVVEIEQKYLKKRAGKIRSKTDKERMKGTDLVKIRRSDVPWK